LLLVNLWTIRCFRADKQRAVQGMRRISEADLLFLAAIGGTPGAFFARHRYRHKTRKQPFSLWLWLIAFIQAGVAIGLTFPG
jgi:uncharacterized membrane protein YsdA (DUF1294 family)